MWISRSVPVLQGAAPLFMGLMAITIASDADRGVLDSGALRTGALCVDLSVERPLAKRAKIPNLLFCGAIVE
jgi:hypothetical protein